MRRLFNRVQSAYAWSNVELEQGIAAVEYGLLAALIAVVIITAVTLVGTNLSGVYNAVAAAIHS